MWRDGFKWEILVFTLLGVCATSLRLAWGIPGKFSISRSSSARRPSPSSKAGVYAGNQDRESRCSTKLAVPERRPELQGNLRGRPPQRDQRLRFLPLGRRNDGSIQSNSQDPSSDTPTRVEGETIFSSVTREYIIEIASQEASYTLTVEDCDGSSAVRTVSQQPVALPRTGRADTRRLL